MDPVSRPIFRAFHVSEDLMSFFTALVTSKIAAGVLAGGTLAAGGTAAAAYTGTLPAPLQQSAHTTIGAPAAADAAGAATTHKADAAGEASTHKAGTGRPGTASKPDDGAPSPHQGATPVGPDATGPAAYGLCTAFTNGGLDASSTAYQSLSTAANGNGNIASYCDSVAAPGGSDSHRPETPDSSGKSAAPHAEAPQPPAQADAGLAHKPATAGGGLSHKPAAAGKP
jgi:hypothetical protein